MSEMTPEPLNALGIVRVTEQIRLKPNGTWFVSHDDVTRLMATYQEAAAERDALRERVERLESQVAVQAQLIQSVHSDLMMGLLDEALDSMERFHDPNKAVVHAHWDEDRKLREALTAAAAYIDHITRPTSCDWCRNSRSCGDAAALWEDWQEKRQALVAGEATA